MTSEAAAQANVDPGSDIAIAPPGGMLAGIKKEAPAVPQAASVSQATDNAWFWDEGVPGNGPRPAWLKDKYTNIAAQAKAYVDAEKQLGQLSAAPEDYNFGEEAKWDPTNPFMQKFMETAKKSRMSQESFGEMLQTLVEYETSKLPNKDVEIQKLGTNAHERIETVRRWAANNLSQEACNVLGEIGNRADVIKFVDELRQLHIHQMSIPPNSTDTGEGFVRLTLEDIDRELADPVNAQRYVNSAQYRAEIERKIKIIHGED